MLPLNKNSSLARINLLYIILSILVGIFLIRLFYVQVIRHSYYQQAAYNDQLKEYQIPAERGIIEANSGGQIVPLVLNQTLYTLYADPKFVKDPQKAADEIQNIIGGQSSSYYNELKTPGTEYVVLAEKLSTDQANKLNQLNLLGIGTRAEVYRAYPDGSLASQLLGFVDANGQGQYGIEQAMNSVLAGTPGRVKAITDAEGVPLVGNKNNVLISPKSGSNVVLTINLGVQQQVENILAKAIKKDKSAGGSVVVMDPNTGNIVAMANYPTYDPSNYANVSNPSVYENAAVTNPIEVGSIMKTLTVSAALNTNSITANETFADPGIWHIDGAKITDIAQDGGAATRSITDILVDSLNTGATWMLMQMGGGAINTKARNTWFDYMVHRFHLGTPTGIQQGYEASGYVPPPGHDGQAIDLTYANTSFGQAVTATPLQMAAALSSAINGGSYYQPNLVQETISPSGVTTNNPPKLLNKNIVSPKVSSEVINMMESVVNNNWWFYQMSHPQQGYMIGGKTGTAQIAIPGGDGYYANKFNGTFIGFVGISKPQFVIMVEVTTPNLSNNSIDTYAGAGAAAPIFGQVVNILINGGYVNN